MLPTWVDTKFENSQTLFKHIHLVVLVHFHYIVNMLHYMLLTLCQNIILPTKSKMKHCFLFDLTIVPQKSFSCKQWYLQHIRSVHQQLIFGLLQILTSESAVDLFLLSYKFIFVYHVGVISLHEKAKITQNMFRAYVTYKNHPTLQKSSYVVVRPSHCQVAWGHPVVIFNEKRSPVGQQ